MSGSSKSAPYSIEQAVDDEKAFWAQIRLMMREEIEAATRDAVKSMHIVANSQRVVVERLNRLADMQAQASVDVSRLSSWATAESLKNAQLNQRIERLLDILTPVPAVEEPPK